VWVELPDPQGRNPKIRPAVIVTPTDAILPEGTIDVVAVTTQIDQSPAEVSVSLPWHRNGHPRTKLRRRNVADCSWRAQMPVLMVQSEAGQVPVAEMNRILQILAILAGSTGQG